MALTEATSLEWWCLEKGLRFSSTRLTVLRGNEFYTLSFIIIVVLLFEKKDASDSGVFGCLGGRMVGVKELRLNTFTMVKVIIDKDFIIEKNLQRN